MGGTALLGDIVAVWTSRSIHMLTPGVASWCKHFPYTPGLWGHHDVPEQHSSVPVFEGPRA